MPCHVVISNVPGPQFPLYLAGARVHMMLGLGPLLDLMGLFHAVLSGVGLITITFISCREMMPDPAFFATCLREAFGELVSAAGARSQAEHAKSAAVQHDAAPAPGRKPRVRSQQRVRRAKTPAAARRAKRARAP